MFVLLQTMTEGTLRHTFNKAERLCRRNDFEQIFSQGAAFNRFPFRVYWLKLNESTSTVPVKIAISVPKRKIRSAVSRNRIKRLIRESYRLNKQILSNKLKKKDQVIHIMFVYNGNINATFTEIQSKIILILQRLKELNDQTAEQDSDSHSKVL